MNAARFFLALCFVAWAHQAVAEVFKWVDENGRVHYGSEPPPKAKARPLGVKHSHSANPAAEVRVLDSAVQYYPVSGHTPYELHQSMVTNGPFNEIVKERVYAEIQWRLKWTFDYLTEQQKCRINRFNINVEAIITMPQWVNENTAPASMRALWPRVVSRIRRHEDGHKANGIQAANFLARRLKSLPTYDSCDALTRDINGEGERIMAQFYLVDRAFDRTEALKDSPFVD